LPATEVVRAYGKHGEDLMDDSLQPCGEPTNRRYTYNGLLP
jgi:hypothetical protein